MTTLLEALQAVERLPDAVEKLADLLHEVEQTHDDPGVVIPNRQYRVLLEDMDGQAVYVIRQLQKIENYREREQRRYGW